MYSDLFDHLGSSAGGGVGGGNSGSSRDNEKNLLSFKAGKMEMTLQENGKYWVTSDPRRGEIRITWKTSESALYWEWYDRREKVVADRYVLSPPSPSSNSSGCGTLEKVVEGVKDQSDRVLLWTRPKGTGSSSSNSDEYQMYWMQDALDEKDDEIIVKVNQYLADPASANPNASSTTTSGGGAEERNNTNERGVSTSVGGEGSSTSSSERQVDALSNILENLGMPQETSTATSSSSSTPNNNTTITNNNNNSSDSALAATSSSSATGSSSNVGGTLTLADLQGAMASLQQTTPTQQPLAAAMAAAQGAGGPPLQELVTPAAISSLLENEDVAKRLLELLPENQRSSEYLEENLRSPQVQQTLRSLSSALLPDDTGSLEGFHSVLANFHLEGGNDALAANHGNPIQAFLDCILKSVQKEQEEDKKKGDDKEEEQKE